MLRAAATAADAVAAAKVALSRCCHRLSIHAAAFALPPLRCAPLQCFALPPPPLMLSLLPPLFCCQASADVALARWRAAATNNVALSCCRHYC